MRTFGLFAAAIAALISTVAAAPSQDGTLTPRAFAIRDDDLQACGDDSELDCAFLTAPTTPSAPVEEKRAEEDLTNAQRLARGLPIKSPHKRASRVRRTNPSSVPSTSFRGRIRVDRADGSGNLGYLSAHPFSGAQHRYQTIDNAMVVNFMIPTASTGRVSQIDIQTENSDIQTTFPRLALVQGRDDTNSDLSAGSYHYAYVAGSDATSPGATPQNVANSYTAATNTARTAESAVWTYDLATQKITPVWINSDGTPAPTQTFAQSTALYVGGDSGAFASRYPSPVTPVTFSFEPIQST